MNYMKMDNNNMNEESRLDRQKQMQNNLVISRN